MDSRRIALGLLRVARTVLGRYVPLNAAKVQQLRRDFLTFMKNVKRADTYDKAIAWQQAMSRWSRGLDDYLYKQVLGDLKDMKFRKEVDEGWADYWDEEIRKGTWSFVVDSQPPISHANSDINEDQQFYRFLEKLPKWERRVRREARKAWKSLAEFAEWYEQRQGQEFLVNVPTDETINVEGFHVILHGADDLSDYMQQQFPAYMDILYAGLKHYKSRASKVLPLLLRLKLPLLADFRCGLDEGGRYEGRYVMVCPTAFNNPKRMAHIVAHEMAHHVWQSYLSREKQDAWRRFISGNYGKLNLRRLAEKLGRGDVFENKKIMRKDPVLYLQMMGLYDDPYTKHQMQNIFSGDALLEAVNKGTLPEKVNVQAKPISGYASKSPEESFCEAIGLLVSYGPAAVFEEVRELLKQLVPLKVQ